MVNINHVDTNYLLERLMIKVLGLMFKDLQPKTTNFKLQN